MTCTIIVSHYLRKQPRKVESYHHPLVPAATTTTAATTTATATATTTSTKLAASITCSRTRTSTPCSMPRQSTRERNEDKPVKRVEHSKIYHGFGDW